MRLRWLDLDIENAPLTYLGSDFTTAEVTAIAAGFVGEGRINCWLLTRDPLSRKKMLLGFRRMYDQADGVAGHYLLKHDLPILNGAMIEAGLPPLGPKLTSDTKIHFVTSSGVSESQENLSQMYGLQEEKSHMSNASWREANRLTPRGLAKTRARVVGDVRQHMALRAVMIRRGHLRRPQMWRPGA